MNNGLGGGGYSDEVAGLYIGITGEDRGASKAFNDVYDEFEKVSSDISRGNDQMAASADRAAATMSAASRKTTEEARLAAAEEQRLAQARVDAAAATSSSLQNQIELRQRMAQVTADATASQERYLDSVRREIEVTREQARAGEITAQQRLSQTRESYAVPTSEGRYDRSQLREGALNGDKEMIDRYRALIAVDKEVEAADRELTDAIIANARAQADAVRDSVRLGQTTREEAAEQYREQLQGLEQYADARAIVEKRMLENTLAINRETQRSSHERQSGTADALLNAGYLLPGPIGNAATNLGYLGMGGPTALAVGGAAIATIGAGGAALDVAKVAGQDQEAMERLSIAVKDQGGNWDQLKKQVDAWTDAQSRTTSYGREQTLPALQALVDGGVKLKDAFTIVRVAEDAAAGSGKSLTDVSEALMRAFEGQPRALSALGLATRDQIRDGMSFSDVLKIIEDRYRGQATATDDYSRAQDKFKNAVHDLEVELGNGLTPALTDATNHATEFLRSFEGKQLGSQLADAIKGATDLAKAWEQAYLAIKPYWDIYDKIQSVVGINPTAQLNAVKWLSTPWDTTVTQGGEIHQPPGSPGTAGPVSSPDISAAINAAAAAHYKGTGYSQAEFAAILTAVGQQETGLGTAANYNPATGRDRDYNPITGTGNAGAGIFQLDPASGASPAELEKAATDVGYAANKAASMLSSSLRTANGDLTTAFADYNAGGPTAKGLAYAQQVQSRLGPLNPVGNLNIAGAQEVGGRKDNPFADSMSAALENEQRKRLAGVASFRADYEEALQSIIAKESELRDAAKAGSREQLDAIKNMGAAERALADAQAKDTSDATKADRERYRAQEEAYQSQLRHIEDLAAKGQGRGGISGSEEISRMRALEASRASQDDPRAQSDAQALQLRIDELAKRFNESFSKQLSDIEKRYAADFTPDQADGSVSKIRALLRTPGLTPEQTLAGRQGIDTIRTDEVERPLTDDQKSLSQAVEAGTIARGDYETKLKALLAEIAASQNFGITAVADFLKQMDADVSDKLKAAYGEDATAAMKAYSDQVRQLGAEIDESNATQSQKDLAHLELMREQSAALDQLAQKYATLQGVGSVAYKDITASLQELRDREADESAKAIEDERRELKERADAYRQFTDTASDNLLKMFEAGKKGAGGFDDTVKSSIKAIEQDFLRSSISSLFFPTGNGTPFNPLADLQKSVFGTTAPTGFFGQSGSQQSQAIATQAYEQILRSPTGDVTKPFTVQFTPATLQSLTGSSTGVAPGSDTANAAAGSLTSGTNSGGISLGGPLAGFGVLAALTSSLFTKAPTQPVNQQAYANLYGSYGTGASTVFADPSIAHAFGSGVTGYQGAQNLINDGQSAFTSATGLSAAQYNLYKQMFSGSSPSSNYSTTQYTSALNAILNGLGVMNVGTPVNTYSLSRTFGNADPSSMSSTGTYWQGVNQQTGGPGYNPAGRDPGAAAYGVAGLIAGSSGAPSLVSSLIGSGSIIGMLFGASAAAQAAASATSPTSGLASSIGATSPMFTASGSGSQASIASFVASALGVTSSTGGSANGGASWLAGLGSSSGSGAGGLSGLFSSVGSLFSGGGTTDSAGFSVANYNAYTSGGSTFGSAMQGFGYGEALNTLLGGNTTYGTIGSALGTGVGSIFGGPVGGAIGGALGGAIGGLFGPHWGPASNYPDRSDTTRYGTIMADLFGTSKPNGQSFYEDPTVTKAFNGQTGIAGVGALLSGGATAFEEETGLSAAQYQLALKMFGAGATTLKTPTSNVGILAGTGTGASGTYSYTQYGQELQSILQGLSATGVVGPYNSYTFSRTYGNANQSSNTGRSSTTSGTTQTGTGTTSTAAATPAVTVDARGATFIGTGSETVSNLADLITDALGRKRIGTLPSPHAPGYSRKPSV